MKKILILLATVLFVTTGPIQAQDRDRDQTKKQDRIHQEDHLRLQDGSCLLVNQGVATPLREPYKLKNGTTVNPDGSYQLQNQQKFQLRNGECLDLNGNRYLNQNRFNQRKMMTNKQIERVRTQRMSKNKPGNAGAGRRGNRN
jgi:hypothetical protein